MKANPSAELVHDLRRDELEMVEVMQVEVGGLPEPGDDGLLLLEPVEPLAHRLGEWDAARWRAGRHTTPPAEAQ